MKLVRRLILGLLIALGAQFSGCGGEDLDNYQVMDGSARAQPGIDDPTAAAEPAPSAGSETEASGQTVEAAEVRPASDEPAAEQPTRVNAPTPPTEGTPSEASEPTSAGTIAQASVTTTPPNPTPAQIRAMATGQLPPGRATLPGLKREIKLLIPEKVFVPEGNGRERGLRVSFDDVDLLKVLNMDPVPPDVMSYLPDWLKSLDGKRVRLRGWMYPPASESGITRFMFVRDNGICCFGRLPLVYDKVAVTLREGESTDYIQGRAFDVVGTFVVDAVVEEGEVMWLYAMDDALVVDE